ncbi:hypothetical protein EIQ04_18910 [Xanthomonas campestris pv. raphani]
MPPHGPASGEGTAPERLLAGSLKALHTDHRDWSSPANRRGTDAAWMPRSADMDVRTACPALWAG